MNNLWVFKKTNELITVKRLNWFNSVRETTPVCCLQNFRIRLSQKEEPCKERYEVCRGLGLV